MRKNNKKGLTLIELLAVIAIIAILFVLLIPQITSAITKSKESGVMTDFRDFQIAIKSYAMENGGKFKEMSTLNEYLPKDMKIKYDETNYWNYSTELKSPFGSKYSVVHYDDYYLDIATEKYHLLFSFEGDKLKVKTYGFDSQNMNQVEAGVYEDMKYIAYSDGEAVIYGYNNEGKKVDIPNEINGYKVTVIGTKTFLKKQITGVAFGENLEYIGGESFNNNNLGSVVFPESLTSIGPLSFVGAKITSITFGEKVNSITRLAFSHNLLTEVVIPNSVKLVGVSAFYSNPIKTYSIGINTVVKGGAFPIDAVKTIK